MTRRFMALGLIAPVALLAALLLPGPTSANPAETYKVLRTAPSEQITGATGADSTTATTAISGRAQACNNNTTVFVRVDFSGSANDTCVVSCLLYSGGTFLGLTTSTATAGAYVDAAGDNIAPTLAFDLSSAESFEIRHAAPSTGNVDLTWWTGGANPE